MLTHASLILLISSFNSVSALCLLLPVCLVVFLLESFLIFRSTWLPLLPSLFLYFCFYSFASFLAPVSFCFCPFSPYSLHVYLPPCLPLCFLPLSSIHDFLFPRKYTSNMLSIHDPWLPAHLLKFYPDLFFIPFSFLFASLHTTPVLIFLSFSFHSSIRGGR